MAFLARSAIRGKQSNRLLASEGETSSVIIAWTARWSTSDVSSSRNANLSSNVLWQTERAARLRAALQREPGDSMGIIIGSKASPSYTLPRLPMPEYLARNHRVSSSQKHLFLGNLNVYIEPSRIRTLEEQFPAGFWARKERLAAQCLLKSPGPHKSQPKSTPLSADRLF